MEKKHHPGLLALAQNLFGRGRLQNRSQFITNEQGEDYFL